MTSLTIENVPEHLHQQLQEDASRHNRSVSEQALVRLEQSTRQESFDVEAYLNELREYDQVTGKIPLTNEFIRDARDEGRP